MPPENQKKSSSIGTVVFMLGAVLFAALGGVLLSTLLSQSYPQEPVLPIVVAAKDIPAGAPLKKSALRTTPWPRSSIPKGAHRSIKKLLKQKRVPLVPLAKGSAVLNGQLSAPRSGWGVAAKLEGGERAIAIRTDNSISAAQLIYPGAKVDVVFTMRRVGGFSSGSVMSRILLQNVTVLAVGPRIDTASVVKSKKKDSDKAKAAQRVVTLAVTPEQSERLVLAKREGKIDLVLRNPKDDDVVTTSGVTPTHLVGSVAAPDRKDPPQPMVAPPPRARPRDRPRRRVRRRARPRRRAPAATPAAPVDRGPRVIRGTN